MGRAPPTIDFAAATSGDTAAEQRLVEEVRHACTNFGFFQLTNHGVSPELQDQIMAQSKAFFDLPVTTKEQYDMNEGGFHRGYERLRAQNFEKRTEGDLKEGYYIGRDLPLDNPNVVLKKFGQGPNKYPAEVSNPAHFRTVIDEYFETMTTLAEKILVVLAKSLDLDPGWFAEYTKDPVATLRLIHYPPQAPDASALERGIGAHTDFGAITILYQDMVGGLQIWDRDTSSWVDVIPVRNAFVVNLGNMMMRWTNDKYLSNLHRVINKSGQQRYSIPFFFSGNPDFVVQCLPSCIDADREKGAKYDPITVQEWMLGRYADTYGTGGKAMKDLAVKESNAGMEVGMS